MVKRGEVSRRGRVSSGNQQLVEQPEAPTTNAANQYQYNEALDIGSIDKSSIKSGASFYNSIFPDRQSHFGTGTTNYNYGISNIMGKVE